MKCPSPDWQEERPAKQTEEKSDIIQVFLLNPAVTITTLTAALYLHGQALYSGYLNYWGLNTQIFPLPFEDTLTHGAWTYILLGIDKWSYLVGFVVSFLLLYGLVFLLMFKKPMAFIRKFFKTKRINDVQKEVVGEAADRVFQFVLILGIVFTITLISVLSVQKGKSFAEAEHQKIHSATKAPNPFEIVTINYLGDQDTPVSVTGTLLQASPTMFAVHADNDDVLVIPSSRLISVRHHGEIKSAPEVGKEVKG